MTTTTKRIVTLSAMLSLICTFMLTAAEQTPGPVFNRAPLAEKPYAELPLGAIKPEGWLRDELQRMADGMTGHLDQWYPEVCGPRNAWLGGDGDTWERGPYWIDGLYPLAKLLGDQELEAKAMKWIEWTLANQRPRGQIGPYELKKEDRTQPPPAGAQIHKPDDWWPRMVMLKILQQHYMGTDDQRVIECLTRYFRYQLEELPNRPLHDPANPWTRESAPVRLVTQGVRLPYWTLSRNSAALPPLSPVERPADATAEEIRLIPYGATTLRVAAFPHIRM